MPAGRLRVSTRTVGAVYLVVGGATGVGAVLGGGAVAVTWAATCGAMGVAWLARTEAEVQPDRIRQPRHGFRHRDVLFVDLARVHAPHPWALDPVGRAALRDGGVLRLPGLSRDDLTALATAAGVPLVVDASPARPAAAS